MEAPLARRLGAVEHGPVEADEGEVGRRQPVEPGARPGDEERVAVRAARRQVAARADDQAALDRGPADVRELPGEVRVAIGSCGHA